LCGGLGRHFGIDPVIFRIAFVVLALAGGSGILLYLVGWLLIPDDQSDATVADQLVKHRSRQVLFVVLVAAGVAVLFDGFDHNRGDWPLSLVLIGVGAAVLWSKRNGPGASGRSVPTQPPPPADPMAAAPPAPARPLAPPPPPPPPPPPTPAREPRARSVLVAVTLSLLAVLGGILALLGVSLSVGLALALLVTGGALVVGAWRGRARWLIPVAIVLSGALATAAFVDVPLAGGVGDRAYRPLTLAELRPTYRLAVGELRLDLSDLDLAGRTTSVLVTNGIGHLRVTVPSSARVTVVGHAGVGEVDLLDGTWNGTHVDERVVAGGQEGSGHIMLRVRVGIGQVEVQRAAA
jgi:phage shock protein PspC (stress-responsive transcriptional regulator)